MLIPWTLARPGLNVHSEHVWVVVAVSLVGLALVFEAYVRSRPSLSPRRRNILVVLRAAALVVLMLIVLDPTLTLTSRAPEKPTVAVLVDTSRSMGFEDRGSPDDGDEGAERVRPRIQRAFEILWGPPGGIVESLEKRAHVRLYQFAENLAPLEERRSDAAVPGTAAGVAAGAGDQTNMGNALNRSMEWGQDARPDALVLISDGLSNVGRDPVLVASHLGIPVFTVGVGDPRPPTDVALTRCMTNEVAYVDSRVEVRVDFTVTGLDLTSVPVVLREGEALLDSVLVPVGGEGETQRVSLFFTPTVEGVHRYRVEIPVLEGEQVVENNHRLLVVSVLKSKMKVYYVDAYPSWDYTFIRRELERDANVELTARTVRGSEPVLPPAGELSAYDVFILGNLSKRSFPGGEAARLVRAVTDEGKGLVIVGGRSGLDFRGTEIENILPVEPGTGHGRHYVGTFQPVLTAEGALHMVTRLDSDSERNRKVWMDIPPLVAMNVLGKPKPGAERLLIHPALTLDGEPLSVVAVQRVGAGKCVLVSAYTLWRWEFLTAGFGGEGNPFGSFWGNVIRWLVTREDLERVRVATDRHVYRSGDVVVLRAQVYDDLFQPVDGATVVATLRGTDPVRDAGEMEEIVLDPVSVGEGHYEGRLKFLAPGNYRVSARASKNGIDMGEDTTELTVDTYSLEYERTAMAENLLKQVARASGGRYVNASAAGDLAGGLSLERRWVERVREISLSNQALFFVLFAGLLFAEWFLRKRSGLS